MKTATDEREHSSAELEASRESTLSVPDGPLGRLEAATWRGVERLISAASQVGDVPVFERDAFPWVANVEREWQAMRAELDIVMERRARLLNFQDLVQDVGRISDDDQWKTFFFIALGDWVPRNCEMCPRTAAALKQIPGLETAFFSILAPGKRIPVHRGPYNGVLRYHLGLRVPTDRERCWIRVGGERYCWREGESLIFDDSFQHEVHNDTDEYRAILFADFVRPTNFPVNVLNHALIRCAKLLPSLRDGKARQKEWEERFYESRAETGARASWRGPGS